MPFDPVEPFIEHRWEPRRFWLRRPRPVGNRFLVLRGDRIPPDGPGCAERIPILLDIRESFGSGGHGSTEGCLLALEGTVRGGERVLDLGTGSGILAIAARKLGASQVVALDIRKSACREAKGNLLRNGIREGADVLCGGIEAVGGSYDLVLANLRTPTLVAFLDRILERVGDSGLLVVSGIRDAEDPSFASYLHRFPLDPNRRIPVRGWVTRVCRRRPGPTGAPGSTRPSGSGSPG
ncbi:MAG: hypothetical protein Kow00128_19610 [Deltaproteobacteria bacterium]